jgi:YjbE family integral membrane protein
MSFVSSTLLIQILQIIWIDLLLSGDNAVVIALACRSLPGRQKYIGMILGAGAAVGLRLIFTVIVLSLMAIAWLKIVSGLLLIYIAVQLITDDANAHEGPESTNLWHAIRMIVIADAIMSLDNVIAVAAAARGSFALIIFGLALSIPLIIFTSQLFITLIERFPALVWAGAALLGWIAGELMLTDPVFADMDFMHHNSAIYGAQLGGACLVIAIAALIIKSKARMSSPHEDGLA